MVPTPQEIKEARAYAGLTQTQAANLVRVSLNTWQKWEGGRTRMSETAWELFLIKMEIIDKAKYIHSSNAAADNKTTNERTEMENYTVKFQNGFIAEIRARNDAGAKRTASKMKTHEAGNMALYNSAGALIGRRELETWPGGWSWTGWL